MESLLCNEVWLMSPNVQENDGFDAKSHLANSFFTTKEDCEEAFGIFLAKESRFSPEQGYLKLVSTDDVIRNARFKAVNWIVKSQRRMDVSLETIFSAVNYLDRFISLSQCQGWKCWMFELLSIACLSVASKFNDTTVHLLHEFQTEDSEDSFAPSLVQRMELTLLDALDWRMDSATPFSYIDLMILTIDILNTTDVERLTNRVTELLLSAILDPRFLEFQQSVLAMSAVRCVLEDLFPSTDTASFAHLENVMPQEQKDDLIKCQIVMEKLLVQDDNTIFACGNSWPGPSSPVTVLKEESFNFDHDFAVDVDLSVVKMKAINLDLRSSRKRKRERVKDGL